MKDEPSRAGTARKVTAIRLDDPALPPAGRLRELVQEGLGFQDIQDRLAKEDDLRPNPVALGVAMSRAVLRETTGTRFRACVPWAIQPEHRGEEPVRMLRLLGRRRSGLPLEPTMNARLEAWLHRVQESQTVVGYCPDQDHGFVYLPEAWRGPDDELPVRAWVLDLETLARAMAGEVPSPNSPGQAIFGR